MCQLWALQVVIKRQLFYIYLPTRWPNSRLGYRGRVRDGGRRPLSTFGLGWQVSTMPLASAVASSACRSVCLNSRLEISIGLTVQYSAGVSRNSALTYTPRSVEQRSYYRRQTARFTGQRNLRNTSWFIGGINKMLAGNLMMFITPVNHLQDGGFWLTFVTAVCLQYDLIGCSHGNIGRFTGVNKHCSFTPLSTDEVQHWALTGQYFRSMTPLPFDTSSF